LFFDTDSAVGQNDQSIAFITKHTISPNLAAGQKTEPQNLINPKSQQQIDQRRNPHRSREEIEI
jgi:hypothetical protein